MLKRYFSSKTKYIQRITVGLAILAVAVVGTVLLTNSHAVTPYAATTASSGTVISPAQSQTCNGASNNSCVVFGSASGTTSSKYLGINGYYNDLTDGDLQTLHVNSLRDEWSVDTGASDGSDFSMVETSYGEPDTAPYMNVMTAAHIMPLPILDSSGDAASYGTDVTAWCKVYCAGGTFWKNNTTGNSAYAPTVLEITNEPYYGAIAASTYAAMLEAARNDLNAAGLSSISMISEAGDIWHDSWTQAVKSAGGLNYVQGIAIHPYSPSAVPAAPASCPANVTVAQVEVAEAGGGNQGNSWLEVCYMHQTYNLPVYITEQGWCLSGDAVCGDAGNISESAKDANITNMIGNLKDTSWIKGWWYYDMDGDGTGTYGLYVNCYNPCQQTTAFTAFETAALNDGL